MLLAVNEKVRMPTDQLKISEEQELSKHLATPEYSRHRHNLRYQLLKNVTGPPGHSLIFRRFVPGISHRGAEATI